MLSACKSHISTKELVELIQQITVLKPLDKNLSIAYPPLKLYWHYRRVRFVSSGFIRGGFIMDPKDLSLESPHCVWLMTYTSEPVRTIFTAIRTCYSPNDQVYLAYEEYFKYLEKQAPGYPNDAIRLLSKVARLHHLSVLEHASFTFGIRGVSRALLAQLTRHRIGWSYSVQSQRYIDFSNFKYITPKTIEKNQSANRLFQEKMKDIRKTYEALREIGINAEDARYVLPNAALVNITVTCNLRSFLDFYEKRTDEHAQ